MIAHRSAEWPWRGRVVHLALPLDEGVLELLAPATSALARCGQTQSVVLIDDVLSRALQERLDDAVSVVRVPAQDNLVGQRRLTHRAPEWPTEAAKAHRADRRRGRADPRARLRGAWHAS